MGGWLFGMTDIQNTITYKTVYETSFMEKLLMDQEVFKTFVSWNPLDWLYYYIKKFSFISQFKGKEKITWTFIIVWYIKNIQRAKKKWFFVEIEDISNKIEIFMKDTVDFKKNDIVILHIFKWRSVSIEKIIRTSRDLLIQQAGSKYDPAITVIKAKILRLEWTKPPELQKPKWEPVISLVKEPIVVQDIFPIPDNIDKIHKISEIIKTYPGDQKLTIGSKEIFVNEDGVQKIIALYTQ
jgi:hypothetical protein